MHHPGRLGRDGTRDDSYPSAWHTVTAPPNLASGTSVRTRSRVIPDPATLDTAVEIASDPTVTYADALTAATNPTA